MSTLAEELLQDFDDSGSEGDAGANGLVKDDDADATPSVLLPVNGHRNQEDEMELDGDEEAPEASEVDEEMGGVEIKPADDPEAAKAKIEKMQFSGVSDVRSVAGLMNTLTPVLEVCTTTTRLLLASESQTLFTSTNHSRMQP